MTDTERLDFLAQCLAQGGTVSLESKKGKKIVCLFTVESQHINGNGLRDAIDAAHHIATNPDQQWWNYRQYPPDLVEFAREIHREALIELLRKS